MNLPPHPTYKKDVDKLERYFKRGFREIVNILRNLDPSEPITQEVYRRTLRDIQAVLSQIDTHSAAWSQEVITEAFEDSQARALVTLGLFSTITDARENITRTEIVRHRAEQLVEDTFEDMLQATTHTSRKLKKLVREIVADSMRQKAVQDAGYRESVKEVHDRLLKAGFSKTIKEESFVGIVDKAGRRWKADVYSRMVVKTKIQQAQIEGARLEALQMGSDLAVISSHGARDSCSHFEGVVISMSGLTKGYKTLDDLRGSNLIFHPNCQHTVHPISDESRLPKELRDRHKKKDREATKALANPKKTLSEDRKKIR